jgi:glutamate synthase (NADPH/NADH) large chain
MSDMSRFDGERLHQLIANHARYTGSKRAQGKAISTAGRKMLPKFRKVMPVEYRRALQEMEQAQRPLALAGE